jgi:hypothetical protein
MISDTPFARPTQVRLLLNEGPGMTHHPQLTVRALRARAGSGGYAQQWRVAWQGVHANQGGHDRWSRISNSR